LRRLANYANDFVSALQRFSGDALTNVSSGPKENDFHRRAPTALSEEKLPAPVKTSTSAAAKRESGNSIPAGMKNPLFA
jgi:hypothetical protein